MKKLIMIALLGTMLTASSAAVADTDTDSSSWWSRLWDHIGLMMEL